VCERPDREREKIGDMWHRIKGIGNELPASAAWAS
jgi:hypothetical protein